MWRPSVFSPASNEARQMGFERGCVAHVTPTEARRRLNALAWLRYKYDAP